MVTKLDFEIIAGLIEARQRTLDLVADLSDEQLLGPRLDTLNPLRWEIGHVAWFQEKWALRREGRLPLRADADALYDSMAVPHDTRWDLPLPSRAETLNYMRAVHDGVIQEVRAAHAELYYVLLGLFHEDMHDEAFTYARQTLAYAAPRFTGAIRLAASPEAGPLAGDAALAGGTLLLGRVPDEEFVWDNEKWAHPVHVHPFRIARSAVTQSEFAAFVEDEGYTRPDLWSDEGRRWRDAAGVARPAYWRRGSHGWERRVFDRWVSLEPHRPVIHVNWYEADAYCRWAGRRLPTEPEWEMAASWDPQHERLRRYPWGDEAPSDECANLDWAAGGTVDVAARPAGDSACGCRQMLGNVWEWTSTPFAPYPGFVPDPYKEYSEPWFHSHFVLRGGCWATRSRLIRNTWRNFYRPERGDVWAGFRTCAL